MITFYRSVIVQGDFLDTDRAHAELWNPVGSGVIVHPIRTRATVKSGEGIMILLTTTKLVTNPFGEHGDNRCLAGVARPNPIPHTYSKAQVWCEKHNEVPGGQLIAHYRTEIEDDGDYELHPGTGLMVRAISFKVDLSVCFKCWESLAPASQTAEKKPRKRKSA